MLFTGLTKSEADTIGEFEFSTGNVFSPYGRKWSNGNYTISKDMYDLLKDTEQFKKIDWSGKVWSNIETLEFEEIKR